MTPPRPRLTIGGNPRRTSAPLPPGAPKLNSHPLDEPLAPEPFVSLIVATLGPTGHMDELLQSMAALEDAPPFEVIVVDQNDDDRLAPLLARFSGVVPITHERVDFRGASRARNHGARLARGQWLGFPDDDCQLRPLALNQMHAAVLETGLRIVTGRTINDTGEATVLRWGSLPERFNRWTMFHCITECTLFVERELFASVGGFDPSFGPGAPYPAAEGIDLVNRLLAETREGYFSPAIEFIHPSKIPPWNAWAIERFGQYAIGDGALIAKNPSLPLLYWGSRTVLAALHHLVTSDSQRRAAYAARLRGLLAGLTRYHRPPRG